ncbi:hypothetical protein [Bordetella phage vB_BbrM_PHB04]|uniref:Uncharacterized protein n=1 Tax=Bordetella phage vB_BbrM_PHB04 TaxID=2029657 RepID=A0A291LA27_9CAUD|nr:virion structural protein [Bordetella phage vB_BbrM_PHB04]ATI15634.1 hypothetical protein [Bordetella phage vB_BbrM_PHB04]
MRLDPAAFNAHLNHMGQKFLWRKAFRCPCVNPHSGAARLDCPQCGGKSWLWVAPKPAVAGVASQQIQLRWAQFGLWQDGDMVVSIPENSPMYEMGQFDRVVMLNSTDYFSLPLVHGDEDERLHVQVDKITRVFWLDQAGAIVEGGIPTVGAGGVLTWADDEPPLGTTYSITGTRFTEYFCWGPYPSDRNEHQGARLPKRLVMRSFDLFGRDLAPA